MKLLFVCGKGGVGKTAVTAALGRYYASRGGALLLTVTAPHTFMRHIGNPQITTEPIRCSDGRYAALCQGQTILNAWIKRTVKLAFVSQWLTTHPLYQHLTTITPGLKELLILDHIFSFTEKHYENKWQTVVVDLPATGHGLNLLNITETAANAVKYGPLRRRLKENQARLNNPDLCRAIVVTLPEETPLSESRELITLLQNRVSLAIDSVIINRIEYLPMSPDSLTVFRQTDDPHLMGYLTEIQMQKDKTAVESVRHAVDLQTMRSQKASQNVADFCNWWQEPVVRIQRFYENNPESLSTLIAESLGPGGYHDVI